MLDPKLDIVFKLLLSRPDNESLLREMIEAVVDLPAPIAGLTVLNPGIPRDLAVHKAIVLDLHVRCVDGTLLDIEMETQPRPVLPQRVLYYWASLYGGQLQRGHDYDRLRRTLSVVWLNGKLPVFGERFHSVFELAERHTRGRLTDHLELHFLALPSLWSSGASVSPRLGRWARFFLAPDEQTLHALAVEDPTMSKAVTELERLSHDPQARALIDTVERDRRFHEYEVRLGQEEARAEGRVEGRVEGEQAGRLAVARELLSGGMSLDQVARVTGLTREALAAVAQDVGTRG